MYGFFFLSLLYLGLSGVMLYSNTFQRTFEYWIFIAAGFSVSWALLLATIALAVVCTLNFGKGLPHYFERRNGEDDDYNDDFHPTPDERNDDPEKISFPSPRDDDAVVISFPNGSAVPVYMKRSESATSYMSQESLGSIRLPPLQAARVREMPHVVIPPMPNAVLGRDLTPSPPSQAVSNSSFSPSWTPGDDRAMMAKPLQRFDSVSTFGNSNSAERRDGLDRNFSFGTKASSGVFVPIMAPQRSLTASSKMSTATTGSSYSNSRTPTRKRTIDLGREL